MTDERELKILDLADYYEKFTVNGSQAYLIVNNKAEDHKCMFGFTELTGDISDAKLLFEKMEIRALELGFDSIVGPVNYCSWMSYRWTISGFDLKLYPDCTNPPSYPQIIEKLGYRQLYTYRSAVINIDNPMYLAGEDAYNEKLAEGFDFRLYRGNEAYDVVKDIFDISCDAFRGSYLYSDIPFEYFSEIYLSWTKAVDAVMYVAYIDGRAVGYVMGYESPYGGCFISKTSAVRNEYRKNKLYTALLYLGCRYVREMGYNDMIYHFQCEQKSTFRRFDSNVEGKEKRYAVYIKELRS